MNSNSVRKQNESAVSKASKKLDSVFNTRRGNSNRNKMKKRLNRKSFRLPQGSGVIYLGHIPHGFYEDEMKSYFSQFGKVTATAVARSKKTGRSRGYGFVEFKDQEVAKIAAETMNNYLMFNRIIKCRYIPPEERNTRVNPGTISTSNYPRQKNRILTRKNNKQAVAKLDQATHLKKVQKKVNQFKKFFEENGIDFTFKFNPEEAKLQENTPETNIIKQTSNNEKLSLKQEVKMEIKDDTENQFGVLEIDESDNEISFKTPPRVKKVIKKSLNSSPKLSKKSALSKNEQTKEIKVKQLKNKTSKKIQEKEKINKKSESRQRLDKKVKTKVKLPQSGMTKVSSKKDINAVIKQNNLKVKRSVGLKELKKGQGRQVGAIKGKKDNKKILK